MKSLNFWLLFGAIDLLFVAVAMALVFKFSRKRRQQDNSTPSDEELRRWESRAPGWSIQCLKCGFTEPYGKYGIRKWAAGTSYTWGYCPHCDGLRFYRIKRKQAA